MARKLSKKTKAIKKTMKKIPNISFNINGHKGSVNKSTKNVSFDIGRYKGSVKKTKRGYNITAKKKGFFER